MHYFPLQYVMIQIKNRERLVSNGETQSIRERRAIALECVERAINAADPKQLVKGKLRVDNCHLEVEGFSFDLSKLRHVYVVGGGKAGTKMAQAIEEALGSHVTAGIVNIPYGTFQKTNVIELNEVNHPIPDQAGVNGALRIMALAKKAEKDDLIICLISGGGSSLMPLPIEGISLEDKQAITSMLLKSGAPINEINCVRKHLSALKGGWLAKKAYPATVLNLILSDVMGDPLDSIASGPTLPDPSTFDEAKEILEKYNLWSTAPASIRQVLLKGTEGLLEETPKADDKSFKNAYNVVIGNNRTSTLAAVDCLNSKGFNITLLADALEGEAREVGLALANTSKAFDCYAPYFKRLAVIAGGETTVTVKGRGLGGRNQELALAFALNGSQDEEYVFASFGTDGIDGPTDAAGVLVDNCTLKRAARLGLDPQRYLAENDSYHFFLELDDLIYTGPTGTNVNDVSLVLR
jgi:glycerate 2-kinase